MQFGFYPDALNFSAGDVSITTLPALDIHRAEVANSGFVEGDWVYSPPLQIHDMFASEVRTSPRSGRIFGLPKTHELIHGKSHDSDRLRFLIWTFGFIAGIRLTETERGFLDATPITPGTLHDIVWFKRSDEKALAIADLFWTAHATQPKVTPGLMGVIHSLFLSQTPIMLNFEAFMYLYMALDGCYAVWTSINGKPKNRPNHHERIAYVCNQVGRQIPDWAHVPAEIVAGIRSATLHEGLFFDERLGFQIYGGKNRPGRDDRNILLEMQNLVCRFICAIVGFNDVNYIRSDLGSRQRYGVEL